MASSSRIRAKARSGAVKRPEGSEAVIDSRQRMASGVVSAAEFDRLFHERWPLVDVRAEVEFAAGAMPGAVNLPILSTDERAQVGTCYKQHGQAAAIALGHRLVGGVVRADRTARWCEFLSAHPGAVLHCWRGGMRSQLAAEWVAAEGFPVRVVAGGYKALRQHLLQEFAGFCTNGSLIVVGGRTGSGKTVLVRELAGGVDLEGFAHHRGSSFGRRTGNPPSQATFENGLAVELLRQRGDASGAPLFLEDESRQIGPVTIPLEVHRAMKKAPLVVLESAFDERVERILAEYVDADLASWLELDPADGFACFSDSLKQSLARIQRRLGGERCRHAERLLDSALDAHAHQGDTTGHRAWIALLLDAYYDPMYEYQLSRSAERVVFRGDYAAVWEWCCQRRDEFRMAPL